MNKNILLIEYKSLAAKNTNIRVYWNELAHKNGTGGLKIYIRHKENSKWIPLEHSMIDNDLSVALRIEAHEQLYDLSEDIADVTINISDGYKLILSLKTYWYYYALLNERNEVITHGCGYSPSPTLQGVLRDIRDMDDHIGLVDCL